LGLPGINPIIPLGYGIVALVVGVVLHEFMHGIIARSQKIGVKSLGILWLVVPIGAFVEQDDVEMMKAPRRHRDRVAAAGVLANFALAVAFFLILAAVVSTSVQTNADGVGVVGVVAGTPAANISLAPGDIITSLNGTPTTSTTALLDVLSHSRAGQTMALTYYSSSQSHLVTTNVTLAPLSSFTGVSTDSTRGFLGVSPAFLTPTELRGSLVWPASSPRGPFIGLVDWLVLPLAGLEPLQGSPQNFFHFGGALAGADPGNTWILLNMLYWLAWMNLLLGLSNALPLYPLDGGLLFRDFTASIATRLRRGWDEAKLDRFGGRATAVSSLVVLGLLIWQFLAPHL
jgi:membrane-associated protease RseP (regulator of RpoE activity)